MINYIFCDTDIGSALIAQKNNKVCALILGDNKTDMLKELYKGFSDEIFTEKEVPNNIDTAALDVIKNPYGPNYVPLHLTGTQFQLKVWEHLKTIPAGKTETYSEVAQYLGHTQSHRAVANACSNNKIAILIPCHRVVNKDKKLTGYRWGAEFKRKLLEKEQKRG